MSKAVLATIATLCTGMNLNTDRVAGVYIPSASRRVAKKCLLKECAILTTHNGGYCCPEHCKLDKRRVG